ncbi:MAG: hypothetical protein EA381_06620 [Planctomycetaceae bacterium]|nr:MAG: hypothetical protein EA381_06620 [Planctomycetaceae bacterium]
MLERIPRSFTSPPVPPGNPRNPKPRAEKPRDRRQPQAWLRAFAKTPQPEITAKKEMDAADFDD